MSKRRNRRINQLLRTLQTIYETGVKKRTEYPNLPVKTYGYSGYNSYAQTYVPTRRSAKKTDNEIKIAKAAMKKYVEVGSDEQV